MFPGKRNFAFALFSLVCFMQASLSRQTVAAAEAGGSNFYASGDIAVFYPKKDTVVEAPATYIVGSCLPGVKLKVNGKEMRINAQGFFAQVIPLAPGLNEFKIEDGQGRSLPLSVRREDGPEAIAKDLLKLVAASAYPSEDLGVQPGDTIEFSIRATPGARVSVNFANHKIALYPLEGQKSPPVNLGADTTYGKQFSRFALSAREIYTGFYKVSASDHFTRSKVIFKAGFKGAEAQCQALGKLSVIDQGQVAITKADDTVVRLGPNMSRTTPLSQGVLVYVDGFQGNSMRILLAPEHHVFIDRKDLDLEGPLAVLPQSEVRTVNLESRGNEERVVVPLKERLPYRIKQSIRPNSLSLTIYGATANTDWVTPQSGANTLIDQTSFRQVQDRIYELKVALAGQRQWGFYADYEGTNLVLHIKKPPHLVPGGKKLSGLIVCLDPGHGGEETGAIGPSGVHESQINLAIALEARALLEAEGARVIMTRTTDNVNPSLAERVQIAARSQADVLLSIHNNALPDGRDPLAERGTSCYWYHVQALELARTLKQAELARLGFPDFGTFWDNLALTRPSSMLACLIELGFMVNPDEYALLIRPEIQHKAALALCDGLEKYFSSP